MREGENLSLPEKNQDKTLKDLGKEDKQGGELLRKHKKEILEAGGIKQVEESELNPMGKFWRAFNEDRLDEAEKWLNETKQSSLMEKGENMIQLADKMERSLFQEYRHIAKETGNKEDWRKAKIIAENSLQSDSKVGRIRKLQEELRETEWKYEDI